MLNNIKEQKPATKNQISQTKPDVIKNSNNLYGYFANSINGGHVKPIAWHYVMAGTQESEFRIRTNIKMLTPKTPVMQALKAQLCAYWVPHSRVWKNWEKFFAQKGGATVPKINEIPNIGGLKMKAIENISDMDFNIPITDTDLWRDSWISSYIPKFQTGWIRAASNVDANGYLNGITFPKYDALRLRGFVAIYNDQLRNKEYDAAKTEYNGDTVSQSELDSYMPFQSPIVGNDNDIRGRRQNSYYTDYRTELLGENLVEPTTGQPDDLITITEWEKRVADLRASAENAQKNDWDIISELRGSKPLTEGKVILLGKKTIPLNSTAVAATNETGNITLGEQGAYSYTEIDAPLYQFKEFKEEGYVHVTIQVTADSVFETGFDRIALNVKKDDFYRPDLKTLKNDVLYEIEKCGTRLTTATLYNVTGFKRKWSEYFKAPDVIAGDLTTGGAYQTENGKTNAAKTRFQTQRSYQFFEIDDKETPNFMKKNIWQDYTDILINENLPVMQTVEEKDNGTLTGKILRIIGQNQVFFVGMQHIISNMPIDEEIKNNYSKWAEK